MNASDPRELPEWLQRELDDLAGSARRSARRRAGLFALIGLACAGMAAMIIAAGGQ